jgi:hypothetical protein
LASSLAAAAVAGAFFYGLQSSPPKSPVEARPLSTATAQAQPTSPTDVEQGVSAAVPTETTATPDAPPPDQPVTERSARPRDPRDEATRREQDRRSTLDDVKIAYTLLFKDLRLSEQDEMDLIALLVDLQLESAWTSYQKGRTISAEERSERISAVIGPEKLEQFLALEQNRPAYWETYQIALLLQRRGVPTTPAQRDGIFDILVDVRSQYPATRPPAEVDPSSAEYIAHIHRQQDDFDRHVIELAPGVLSPTQVSHLFQAYDRMSRERIDLFEWQKKMKAEHPEQNTGWMSPARWNPPSRRNPE